MRAPKDVSSGASHAGKPQHYKEGVLAAIVRGGYLGRPPADPLRLSFRKLQSGIGSWVRRRELEASGAFLACPGVLCTSMLRVCGLNEAPGRPTKHLEEQTWNAS